MDFSGRYGIPAPPDAVWEALHDPVILALAIPGCEGVERIAENAFTARASVAIGPLKAHFETQVQFEEHVAPTGFTHALIVRGDGQGGAAGAASGLAEVRLASGDGVTLLLYEARTHLSGALAGMKPEWIDDAHKTLVGAFIAALTQRLQTPPRGPRTAPPNAPPRDTLPRDTGARHQSSNEEGLAPQIWIAGLITIVIILLIVFSVVL